MTKLLSSLGYACILLSISGCVQTMVKTAESMKDHPLTAPAYSKKSYLLFGLDQTKYNPNKYKVCKNRNGVAFVEEKKSFGDGLLTVITLGIYSPSTISLYCADSNELHSNLVADKEVTINISKDEEETI